MTVPFIDLLPQYKTIRREALLAMHRVAGSHKFILGENGRLLEEKIASYVGVPHAVGMASGSDALYLSLVALGVGDGDEVITTPFTFFSTAASITRAGAKVVFCDIDPATCNLDPAKIEAKITRRTKTVLPVHLFGLSCDMKEILHIARRHQLSVVEDAAQSFGATYDGKQTGSMGDAGCFSFYPTKNLGGAGDGGMVVMRSKQIADKLRLLRNHGSKHKYHHEIIGINSRLDELQAAWLLVKMKYIDRWNEARRKHASAYDRAFADLPLEVPHIPKNCVTNRHLYSIQTERRDELSIYLERHGIGNGVYYPLGLHLQRCYRLLGHRKGDFPVTERVTERILSLPMYAEMAGAQIKAVIHAVRSFFR
jgi:dTDP-4-amino-4,6-dideoxygalactose transaminase